MDSKTQTDTMLDGFILTTVSEAIKEIVSDFLRLGVGMDETISIVGSGS